MSAPKLTEAQWRMLAAVNGRGDNGVRFSEPTLDHLAHMGLVEWSGCEAYVAYRITPAGRAALEASR